MKQQTPTRSIRGFEKLAKESNLTRGQLLIYLGQKLAPESPLYNMALAFSLSGEIDTDCLTEAIRRTIEQCDAMRTTFTEIQGVPRQRVAARIEIPVELVDFSGHAAPKAAAGDWMHERASRVFALDEPLFETALLRLSEGEQVWFLNVHHLVTDAWAVTLIYDRVAQTYRAMINGESLPGPPPGFVDYLPFEKLSADSEVVAEGQDHWDLYRGDASTPLPLYGRENATASTRSRRLTRRLSEEMVSLLRTLAQRPDVRSFTFHQSMFTVFAAALLAWQRLVSGSQRPVLGTPAHNRTEERHKAIIGSFIELYPLGVEFDKHTTFVDLLKAVREESNRFLRSVAPGGGDPQLQTAYNVVLNYITASFSKFENLSISSEWIHCRHGDPAHHLRLQVHDFDASGGFVLHFDLNEEVFDEGLSELVVGQFLKVLETMVLNPESLVVDVALQNIPPPDPWKAPPGTVVDAFLSTAHAHPESIAIRSPEGLVSFAELASKSLAVASSLVAKGVSSGDKVGICFSRTADAVVAILGVLRAGAAYLPLEVDHPPARQQFILNSAAVRLCIVGKDALRLDHSGIEVCGLDTLLEEASTEISPASPRAGDLAYCIYTSGSTGQPKGVEIAHGSLMNYASWARREYAQGEPSSFPWFTPLSFDLTVTSIFVPLLSGGEIVVYPRQGQGGDLALLDVIDDDRVDAIKLTPSHLALLRGRKLVVFRIRTLILGGEDLRRDVALSALESFGGKVTIFNEYGPTEATVGCMIHRFEPANDSGTSVPIGRPGAGAELIVVDPEGHRVPDGVAGELYIGGPGLARGYLGRPDLTAESFVQIEGRSYYRSGDLVRVDTGGNLVYLGRGDTQVKLRGVRIEQGEIEAALTGHPDVLEAAIRIVDGRRAGSDSPSQHCTRCGLPSNYPGASFDRNGVCHLCNRFADYQERARSYFLDMGSLRKTLQDPTVSRGDYDCLVLFSGGKDSTYALCQLADMGLRVYAFTLDNGYISDQAKQNISRVVEELGVEHMFATTPAMKAIFADSLQRYSNVCNGCFKTIYTLATKKAVELDIPFVVTGLSRGQFFETRLTEELFGGEEFDPDTIDDVVLDARKAYHRSDDAVNRLLDGSCFQDDSLFERVRFVDFYRYCPASLEEMYSYLDRRVPWIRPTDTGRSTNCRINDAGIYVHKKERGFHNYAFPYSWDVRMGHKERDAALEELDDEIDEAAVAKMLDEVGYRIDETGEGERLAAYYLADRDIPSENLRAYLSEQLPSAMIPTFFMRLDELPLTANGKLNREALPAPGGGQIPSSADFQDPRNAVERTLAEIWKRVLRLPAIGMHDRFLDLGGDSIGAIQVAGRVREAGFALRPAALLANKSIAELSTLIEPTEGVSAEQGRVAGPMPLVPVAAWFFEQGFARPGSWSQSMAVRVPAKTTKTKLSDAWRVVQAHHDALRSRFADGQSEIIEENTELLYGVKDFDLERGQLASAELSDPVGDSRVLRLTLHHLVVDAVSWPLLLTDLSTALAGRELPRKTTSYLRWAQGLAAAAESSTATEFWLGQTCGEDPLLPAGKEEGAVEMISHRLNPVPVAAGRATLNELLMTALLLALKKMTGSGRVGLELEGHGREDLLDDVDVSRTVGWFTSRFPFWVDLSSAKRPESALREVREALGHLPHRGASYGMLRYGHPAARIREALSSLAAPQVLLNFLGESAALVPVDSGFELEKPLSLERDESDFPASQIEVAARIGGNELLIDWSFRAGAFTREQVTTLADTTQQFLRELDGKHVDPVATDFKAAGLDKGKLEKLTRALSKLK